MDKIIYKKVFKIVQKIFTIKKRILGLHDEYYRCGVFSSKFDRYLLTVRYLLYEDQRTARRERVTDFK